MNEVYGPLFAATRAEAADKDMAAERAKALAGQFIMDTHTHFLKDDTRLTGFVRMREAVGRAGWNPGLAGRPQTIEDLKFDNYFTKGCAGSRSPRRCRRSSGSPRSAPPTAR